MVASNHGLTATRHNLILYRDSKYCAHLTGVIYRLTNSVNIKIY